MACRNPRRRAPPCRGRSGRPGTRIRKSSSSTSPTLAPSRRPPTRSSARPGRPRRPRQQRRRDGSSAARDGGRVRAAVRDEPPRALRAHRPADREAPRVRCSPRRQRQQHRPTGWARWTSTTSTGRTATPAGPPTDARSSPTCSSPSSSRGGPRRPGTDLVAAASHPGYAATNLQTAGIGLGAFGTLLKPFMKVGNVVFAQNDAMGALPTLYAATAPGVEGDDFFGPDGIREMRGKHPKRVGRTGRAANGEDAQTSLGGLRGADRGDVRTARRGRRLARCASLRESIVRSSALSLVGPTGRNRPSARRGRRARRTGPRARR